MGTEATQFFWQSFQMTNSQVGGFSYLHEYMLVTPVGSLRRGYITGFPSKWQAYSLVGVHLGEFEGLDAAVRAVETAAGRPA